MLGYAKLETAVEIDSGSQGVLNADRVEGPGVQSLGNCLTGKKRRRAIEHESAQGTLSKGADLQDPREHVAREHAAGSIDTPVLPSISAAQVGVNLVMRRRQIKLRPPPKHVPREKHAFVRIGGFPCAVRTLLLLYRRGRRDLRPRAGDQC